MALTVKQLDSLKPKQKEYLVPDIKRLFIRIRSDGSKSWLFIYQWDGKRIKMAIYGDSLAEIRAQASRYNEWLDIGLRQQDDSFVKISPKHKLETDKKNQILAIEERELALERQKLESTRKITVNQLFERWLSIGLRHRKGVDEIKRMFNKDVLPEIGDLRVEDVKKHHIVKITNNIKLRDVSRMVKLVLSLVRQMFRFACDQDIIENDPTSAIRKTAVGGKDTLRDRVLTDEEISLLFKRLPDSGLTNESQTAIKILLSTCCRVGELLKVEWHHVNFDKKTWIIPPENSKNGKKHTIYLSDYSLLLFKTLEATRISSWIFPNRQLNAHVCTKSLSKQVGDRQFALKGKVPMKNRSKITDGLILIDGQWTPHDLRRTGSTLMGTLGVRPDVIEKCLNHTEQNKMTLIYQRQTLTGEQRDSWQLLGEKLASLHN